MFRLICLAFLLVASAFAQPHSVTLAWNWSQGTGDPATGFHVQRSAVKGGPYAVVATTLVGTLSYVDTAVAAGQQYYYVVTAYNSGGDSVYSNEVACTIPFQAPTSPAGLSGTTR